MTPRVVVPREAIEASCRRWRITELALFGSVLEDNFGPESDVDVLVSFEPAFQWGWNELAAMLAQLGEMFGGRRIDFVEKEAVTNPFRQRQIRETAQVLYAA
jgi:predicted nucleotidyltransferase